MAIMKKLIEAWMAFPNMSLAYQTSKLRLVKSTPHKRKTTKGRREEGNKEKTILPKAGPIKKPTARTKDVHYMINS